MPKNKTRESTASLIAAARHSVNYAINLLDSTDEAEMTADNSSDIHEALESLRKAYGQLCHLRNRLGDQKAEQ
jgi:hypothetical protein